MTDSTTPDLESKTPASSTLPGDGLDEKGNQDAAVQRLAPSDEPDLPGVARIEAINSRLGTKTRTALYVGIFLVSWAAFLSNLTFGTYQGYATSSWDHHSLLSTINVVRGVISAAVLPLVANLSDLVGRLESFLVTTVFFVLGSIIQASAHNIEAFAVGSLFYQIGYTTAQLMVEVLVADTTSLRSRLFFLFLPSLPNLVNVWISGNMTSAILNSTTWRWGIGMWCIIYPVCTLPLIVTLVVIGRRAAKSETGSSPYRLGRQMPLLRMSLSEIRRKLDLVGLFLLTATLSLLFIPLTLAGGETRKWKTAGIITPVVLGALCLPLFVFWESRARHPLLPFAFIKDRSVWAAVGIAFFAAASWTAQSEFLYTVLLVGYDFSILTATRVSVVAAFCEAAGGILVGGLIYKFRRAKYVVVAGVVVFFVAYGLMYYYRGGAGGSSHAGVVAGQVLIGTATSMVTFPNIVIAMALCKHENLAVLTSVWLAMNWAGYALGNCVAGALWTQTLYERLQHDLGPINATLVDAVYAEPLYVVPAYPVGTPERTAIITSYRYIQKLLTITGMGLFVPVVIFALCLRNPKLLGYGAAKV